ncbi:MAG: TetR/AcrR family transcriptional regulator [Campylobacter sp.]|nr:TetR/AcrR family transcriptional regulator [Campylobacter sp.]
MIDKKEIADYLEIQLRTLYNWEKSRPKLYKFIIENFYKNNEKISNYDELRKYFDKLNDLEKEYFLSQIKIKVLEKEIKKSNND